MMPKTDSFTLESIATHPISAKCIPFLDSVFNKSDFLSLGLTQHNIWVRHEGASCQRVKVPPGKLTVHPGSYPGIEAGRPPW